MQSIDERFKHLTDGLEVVSEDLRTLTHEVHAEIVPRLDIIDGRLDGIDVRLNGIDNRLNGIDGRLDGIDVRLDGIDVRLDGIDVRLTRLEEGHQEVRAGVSMLLTHFGLPKLDKPGS